MHILLYRTPFPRDSLEFVFSMYDVLPMKQI